MPRKRAYAKAKRQLLDLLTPCVRCGAFDERFMDWHHRDPNDKVGEVYVLWKNKGLAAAFAEIEKCDCYCSNCHRILHAEQRSDC